MDNQFHQRKRNDSAAKPEDSSIKPGDAVIDLYDDFKDPNPDRLEADVEELKKLAQADALRAYGWLRRTLHSTKNTVARIGGKLIIFKNRGFLLGLTVVLVVFIGFRVFTGSAKETLGETDTGLATPSFDTLLPESYDESGVKYDPEREVATLQADLNGVSVTISQQVLPEDVKSKPDGVEKLAISLSDKQTINRLVTDKGLAYLVTAESGQQTLIFSHLGLLVFLRSPLTLTDETWVNFVNSLD
ncbi:MAG TPA: hypothetical protein VGA08_00010 [Candidatus Saccharimonadales bacterium]